MFASPFPNTVAFAVLSRDEAEGYVLPPEEAAVLSPKANKKRREDFQLGRAAASQALAQLGVQGAVPKGKGREPLWPEGIVGSISHSGKWGVAAVAHKSEIKSIGIDIEALRKPKLNISRQLCRAEELRWIDDEGEEKRDLLLIQLFSAKESAFKALYPLTKCLIGFQDVLLLPSKGGYRAKLAIDLDPPFVRNFEFMIGITQVEQYIMTYTYFR